MHNDRDMSPQTGAGFQQYKVTPAIKHPFQYPAQISLIILVIRQIAENLPPYRDFADSIMSY